MTLISSEISSFTGGVSQQPPSQRLSSQLEEQINGFSTVAQGLQKRPPTEHIARVLDYPVSDAFMHTINRDITERYLVFIADGDLKVFDLEGNEIPVAFPDGKDYLVANPTRTSFSALTVADYTFIVNQTKKVLKGNTTSQKRPYEALVNVKLGNYGKTYSITINGSVAASYTTPDGSSPSHSTSIGTDRIAQQLYNQLVNYKTSTSTINVRTDNSYTLPSGMFMGGVNTTVTIQYYYDNTWTDSDGDEHGSAGWATYGTSQVIFSNSTEFSLSNPPPNDRRSYRFVLSFAGGTSNTYGAVLYGSSIYLSSEEDFTLSCEDGYNHTAMIPIKGKVNKLSDLPAHISVDGFKCLVIGEAGSEDDDYWVEYSKEESSGVWVESVKPDVILGVDKSTMPHQLVRQADGTFVFQQANWKDRTVGDDDSNPMPSFVGRKIANMFFFRNRLGFLVDDSMVMSENAGFFNFFRTSVKTLLDNDPIDLSVSHTKVALLHWAIPYNKELVLFSEQTQFVLQDSDILTAKTAAVKQTTDYPCSTLASPVSAGKNIYFCVDKGNYSSVREYYSDTNTGEEATDITAHIPSYIRDTIFKIASSPTEDIFVCLADSKPNSLYPYSYFWNGQQKLQSSWSRWDWEPTDKILYAEFINSILYVAVSRFDGVYLESMDLSLAPKNNNELYKTHLDRRIETEITESNRGEKESYFPVPYGYDGGDYSLVIQSGEQKAGKYMKARWDGEKFLVDEYLPEGTKVLFGRDYTFSAELSTIYPTRHTQSGGTMSYTEGRLSLTRLSVNFANTGYFKVNVTPEGRSMKTKVYSGKTLGTTAELADLRTSTGVFRVPIMTKNINTSIVIENDSPLPSSITSAVWEGDYTNRSQRM